MAKKSKLPRPEAAGAHLPLPRNPFAKELPQGSFVWPADVRVLVCLPTMSYVHASLSLTMIRWARDIPKGHISFYAVCNVAPVDRARNQLVDYFLKHPQFTHLLFIDSDTVPPADGLYRLLRHRKPIVSGLTPMLQWDSESGKWGAMHNCFSTKTLPDGSKITEAAKMDSGLVPVDRCGGSFLLIEREVLATAKSPVFRFVFNEDGLGHAKSEDVYFCDTARERGYQVLADTSCVCQHYKQVML